MIFHSIVITRRCSPSTRVTETIKRVNGYSYFTAFYRDEKRVEKQYVSGTDYRTT